jgi:hypothetical protein
MNRLRGLMVLRIVLGLVVGGYSLALVIEQLRGHTHHPVLLLGVAELAASILLLIPQTVRLGGISLMVVFAVAAIFHALHGEYSIGFLAVYAAAAYAVVAGEKRV